VSDAGEVTELEVTWNRALVVWWSYLWRVALIAYVGSFAGGFILGIPIGYFGAKAGLPLGFLQSVSGALGQCLALALTAYVMFRTLKVKFKRSAFRIVLVEWIDGVDKP